MGEKLLKRNAQAGSLEAPPELIDPEAAPGRAVSPSVAGCAPGLQSLMGRCRTLKGCKWGELSGCLIKETYPLFILQIIPIDRRTIKVRSGKDGEPWSSAEKDRAAARHPGSPPGFYHPQAPPPPYLL